MADASWNVLLITNFRLGDFQLLQPFEGVDATICCIASYLACLLSTTRSPSFWLLFYHSSKEVSIKQHVIHMIGVSLRD